MRSILFKEVRINFLDLDFVALDNMITFVPFTSYIKTKRESQLEINQDIVLPKLNNLGHTQATIYVSHLIQMKMTIDNLKTKLY